MAKASAAQRLAALDGKRKALVAEIRALEARRKAFVGAMFLDIARADPGFARDLLGMLQATTPRRRDEGLVGGLVDCLQEYAARAPRARRSPAKSALNAGAAPELPAPAPRLATTAGESLADGEPRPS